MTRALKLLLAPLLFVISSLARRRWGSTVAGILVALPVVAGPILLFTALDHGRAFAAQAASSALLGLVALALFALVFVYLSSRSPWLPTLLVSWITCLAAGFPLSRVECRRRLASSSRGGPPKQPPG
jgi:hypothetical protein